MPYFQTINRITHQTKFTGNKINENTSHHHNQKRKQRTCQNDVMGSSDGPRLDDAVASYQSIKRDATRRSLGCIAIRAYIWKPRKKTKEKRN